MSSCTFDRLKVTEKKIQPLINQKWYIDFFCGGKLFCKKNWQLSCLFMGTTFYNDICETSIREELRVDESLEIPKTDILLIFTGKYSSTATVSMTTVI